MGNFPHCFTRISSMEHVGCRPDLVQLTRKCWEKVSISRWKLPTLDRLKSLTVCHICRELWNQFREPTQQFIEYTNSSSLHKSHIGCSRVDTFVNCTMHRNACCQVQSIIFETVSTSVCVWTLSSVNTLMINQSSSQPGFPHRKSAAGVHWPFLICSLLILTH